MPDVRSGFLAVDPELLASILRMSKAKASTRMSTEGAAWHGEGELGKSHEAIPFLRTAIELTGEISAPWLVRWWSNVLHAGAEYRPHKHDGKWAFVYHLTEGATVHFVEYEASVSFRAVPGQILVFSSSLLHWTDRVTGDAPRVSIAGNLYFRSIPRPDHGASDVGRGSSGVPGIRTLPRPPHVDDAGRI